jgi:hypothetical protein
MSHKKYLGFVAMAGLLGLSLLLARETEQAPVREAPDAKAAAAPARARFAVTGQEPAGTAHALVPLARQVDQLAATGKPADAFKAYHLVNNCLIFEKWGTIPLFPPGPSHPDIMTDAEKRDESALCVGMTERIKMSRLDHLKIAAKGGVEGADSAFLHEGPLGDPSALETRPDDPAVAAWKQQAIAFLTARAYAADYDSLMTLADGYMNGSPVIGKDTRLAFTYASAMRLMTGLLDMPAMYGNASLADMKRGLTQEEIGAAEQAAARIAARFREIIRKYHRGR